MRKISKCLSISNIETEHDTHCFTEKHFTKGLEPTFSCSVPESMQKNHHITIRFKLISYNSYSFIREYLKYRYYHTCSFTFLSSTGIIFVRKSIPIVGRNGLSEKQSSSFSRYTEKYFHH